MKKALILTYYWPPGSGPGVQRWLKFVKYLPEFGWQPTVVTVKDGSYPSVDESLLGDVSNDVMVYRTKTLEPFAIYNALRGKKGKSVEVAMGSIKGNQSMLSRIANFVRANFFVPDARVGWNRFAKRQALDIIRRDKPDVIITTGPPHSTHLVGQTLHRETGIPWLADMRDPWTKIYYNAFLNRSKSTILRDQKLEDGVLANATAVVAATPGMKAEFEGRASRVLFIPNGYDEDDFEDQPTEKNGCFTLAYVGNLKAFQNTTAVWQAIKELKADHHFDGKFCFEITGNVAPAIQSAFKQYGIEDVVNINPFAPHKASIQRMMQANMLFLPIPMSEGNETILTGKIFEYLATKRPILSVGPTHGDASAILTTCMKEPMFGYDDVQGIKGFISSAVSSFVAGRYAPFSGNEKHANYSRKGTTAGLVELLNEIKS